MVKNTVIDNSVYQGELKIILLTWVFNFPCNYCQNENKVVSTYKYVTAMKQGEKLKGTYTIPPIIWCSCNEMLYVINSKGLYDLMLSLFPIDKNGHLILKSPNYDEETNY